MALTPSESRQNTTFPSSSGTAHGYLALPPSGRGPGVIVIREWWGLDHIAGVCDRLAGEGFVALAPDLDGGTTSTTPRRPGGLMMELPVEQAAADLGPSRRLLLGHEAVTSTTVGAVGFCMGGGFVLLLAAQQAAAVPSYGVGPAVPDTFKGLTAAVLGHYGERDDFYPADQAARRSSRSARSRGAEVTHYYDAGHAFTTPGTPSTTTRTR